MDQTELNHVFRDFTGYNPYPYQIRPAQQLLEDKANLVMTAPTGSGKTWMSCLPFVYAKKRGLAFADRMFYVLPQRTLVTAVADTMTPALNRMGLTVKVQMGGQSDDPFFEADVIVTTIDQLLSTYLGVSFGARRSASNIAQGAIVGSYIVMDEFHMLEVSKSLSTFIDMAARFPSFVKVLMMTATAPTDFLQEVAQRINGKCLEIQPQEIRSTRQNNTKKRVMHWHPHPISAQDVLDKHQNRTLVVVNTVKKAQQLYREIKEILDENSPVELVCLHARYLPEDRQEKERIVKQQLKPPSEDRQDKDMIVIGNQVVEVGLDVSSTVMLTELCPANSLVQRMGRCARNENITGEVHVYELDENKHGRNYAPYHSEELMTLVDKTRQYLEHHCPASMTANEELAMVQAVHENSEYQALRSVNPQTHTNQVNESIIHGQVSKIRDLVRDVDNIEVIIHDRPSELNLYHMPQRFSVPLTTLRAVFQKEDRQPEPIQAWYPSFPDEGQPDQQPEWKTIHNFKDLRQYTLIALSPRHVAYDREVGLIIGEQGSFTSQETQARDRTIRQYAYTKESYVEHARDVRHRIRRADLKYEVFAQQAARELGVSDGKIHEWCEWTGALHDVGKLRTELVHAYQLWQKDVCADPVHTYLAHTDYDPDNPVHREKIKEPKYYRRVSHAPEGAFAAEPILKQLLIRDLGNDLQACQAVFMAMYFSIRRHHGAYTDKTESYQLVPDAEDIVRESLNAMDLRGITIELNKKATEMDATASSQLTLNVKQSIELALYWHISRRLRLADRQSQQDKNRERG